jgi:uncharacterized membrane protein YfcA
MVTLGFIASILMGLSLGLIGGGGSILTVPILVYLFQIDPVTATAYSLFIVGLTALVGGGTYLQRGEVDLKTGVIFAIPSFIGVYLTRVYVVPTLPDPVFSLLGTSVSKPLLIMLVFAILMLAASISMIKSRKTETKKKELSPKARIIIISLEGLVVGGVTGFVGAGGGFLIIPALVLLVGLPMRIAVGTSLFIIAAKSLLGFLGDLQVQTFIDWPLLLKISGIAILGIFLGMAISKRIDEKLLKKGFGYFVLLMGAFVLFDQIQKL